jgi:L-asparaginase
MTAEAALAKLFYLLALGLDPGQVRNRMQQNLVGESTLPA